MALQYLFDPNKQFQSLGGVNEVGGFLRVFLNGTDDRATTYKNFDGTLNEADIVLDSYGRAVVIVDDTKTYRIEVYNRLGGLMWTVSNYKASGGSGGGSGTPVSVEGTVGEIDVDENTEGGVKHFVIGLASTIKNAITALQLAVNSIGLSLNGKKDKQSTVSVSGGTTKTLVGISQDSDGVMTAEFDDIAFPDWTSAINAAVATCEKLENKKTTVTGFESSNTYYPTIKAVVDFVHGMLQNLGGKLITDNGDPFTDSSDLPSTTPYGGVDISDKDYAYVQGTGFAERWSASVSGSDVTWVQEYSINIPVFTPAQQAAIDSGATSTKINNYELHINNTAIHVTSSEKNAWNAKQNAIGDLAEIRSGAAAGATALQPNGNGSNVTSTFTAASSRTNISSGEKLSTIFGKIAKWFGDLKAVAFSGSYNDLSDKPTIPTVNNGTLTIYRNGVSQGKFSANQSGLTGIDISVPTKTSQLVNDSFASVATSGSYNDLSNKPSIPSAANNGMLIIRQNGTRKGTFSANQSSDVIIDLTNTTYSSLTPEPQDSAAGLCTRGEKFTWGTIGSHLQCARATLKGRYIDIGRLHSIGWHTDVEGVAHFTIVGKLSTWANENNSVQFRADVCVEFRHKPDSYPFEKSRIYGRILYKGNSSQLSSISVVTRTEYHIDTATHYDLVIALSIPNASNNYTRIAVESSYAMNDYVGQVDGISMSYDRDITIYDEEPTGQHIDPNNSYELPTL